MNKETYLDYTTVWSVDETQACFGSTYIFASLLVLAILLLCLYILKINRQFCVYARANATYSIKSVTAYSSIILTFILGICKILTQIQLLFSITGLIWVAICLLSL